MPQFLALFRHDGHDGTPRLEPRIHIVKKTGQRTAALALPMNDRPIREIGKSNIGPACLYGQIRAGRCGNIMMKRGGFFYVGVR